MPGPRTLLPLVLAALAASCGPGVEGPPQNVVLIVIDTLRADHLGCYGYPRDTTPNIDALAARGVRFETAIAHSSWSPPSHSSIMTGMAPLVHRMDEWGARLSPEVRTLQERLGAAGLTTAMFTTHRGLAAGTEGLHRGFDHMEVFDNDKDAYMTERAVSWLQDNAERPFFAHLIYMSPHAFYEPPAPFDTRFASDDDRVVPFVDTQWFGVGGIPTSVRLGDEQRIGVYKALYDGEIAFTDQLVGRVLGTLAELGVADETLVVLTSDHGEAFGEHDHYAHELVLYDTLVRVPLIMAPLDVPPAQRTIEKPVQLVDIVPSILDYLGEAVDPALDGLSLRPFIRGESAVADRLTWGSYLHRGFKRFFLRTTRWKLIWAEDLNYLEVYDLTTDPGELNNLAGGKDRTVPQAARTLAARLVERAMLYAQGPGADLGDLSAEATEALRALGYIK